MGPILHKPPPVRAILHALHWLLAALASIFHFEYGVIFIATTSLPPVAMAGFDSRAIITWGDFARSVAWVAFCGLDQARHAIWNHFEGVVIVLWWLVETCILIWAVYAWWKGSTRPGNASEADDRR